ncbi:MAG: hypothetical protein MRZ62_05070 [Brachyspira sp.]|nr:hypothetical protein [Brachyspira sp.]
MVDSIQGNLPPFTTIKYVTKDGENCQATKNNGVVTVVGDKNGVRQLPQDEFMKEFIQTLPKVNLEKTPKADTVAFSGQGEEIAEEDSKKGTSKGMLATVAVLGTALIGAGIWLLSKGKTGAKIGEAVGQAADAIKPAAEKAETVARETAEAVGNSVKEVTTKAQETIKPAVEKAEAIVKETAEKAKQVVETAKEKAGKKTSAPKSEAKPKGDKKPSTQKTEVKPEVKVEMPKADKKPYQKPEIKVETKPAEVKPAEIEPAQTNVADDIAKTLDDATTAAIIMEGAPHGAKAAGKVAEDASQLSDDIAKAAEELFSGNSGKATTFVDKLEAPVDEVVGEVSRKPTTFVDKLENPVDDVATLHKPTTFVDDLNAPVDDLATLHTPTFTDGLNNPVDDILTNSTIDDIGSTLDSGLGHIDDLVDGVGDFFDGIL